MGIQQRCACSVSLQKTVCKCKSIENIYYDYFVHVRVRKRNVFCMETICSQRNVTIRV